MCAKFHLFYIGKYLSMLNVWKGTLTLSFTFKMDLAKSISLLSIMFRKGKWRLIEFRTLSCKLSKQIFIVPLLYCNFRLVRK